MARELIEETVETPEKKKEFDLVAYMNEKVPVELYKDGNKYKDDLVVTCNGVSIKIPRGKQVMIPRKYKMVIDDASRQNAASMAYQESKKD